MSESKEAREARAELVRAIKLAKSTGINVGAVFYEVASELMLLQFRLLGAVLAGGFVVTAPVLVRLADIYCIQHNLGIRMDYQAIDWLCLAVGIPSMLAFAWQLRTPERGLTEKLIPAIDDITLRMFALRDREDGDKDKDEGTNGGV